jgi:DNA-binding CsgD family transcriptional regulator
MEYQSKEKFLSANANISIEDIFQSYKKMNFNKDVKEYIDSISIDLHLLEEMQIGVYIVDYHTSEYLYINSFLSKLFGVKKEVLKKTGVLSIGEYIHPSDKPFLLNILKQAGKLILKMKPDERGTVIFKVNYRIKNSKGKYEWVMQVNKIIQTPNTNYPIDLGYLIPMPDNNSFAKVVGFLKSKNSYWEINWKNSKKKSILNNLTKREKEILKLTAQGNKSQEIAENLLISLHTVKIHKRNIIRKLSVSSIDEAVAIYENDLEIETTTSSIE